MINSPHEARERSDKRWIGEWTEGRYQHKKLRSTMEGRKSVDIVYLPEENCSDGDYY